MKKIVNGILRDLTSAELTQRQAEETDWTNNKALTKNLKRLRIQRNNLLTECDWTQSPDSPLTDAKKTEWATYRTSLRNLTNGLTTVEQVKSVTWPTKPE